MKYQLIQLSHPEVLIMKIVYHGHSCIQISNHEVSLIMDPFLSHNPVATVNPEAIQADYVLLTHGHDDHILDAAAIAKQNKAPIIAIVELATYMKWQGAETIGMNLGGTYKTEAFQVKMIQAFHSSSFTEGENKQIIYTGVPAGFILTIGGMTILHCGDTALFGDMKMIGDRHSIDLAFIPIGDHFTMGPEDALQAAEWLQARYVVPIHYDTFPPIRQDGEQFINSLSAKGVKGRAMKPGDSITSKEILAAINEVMI
jgi:L-ascorbate metabolism protein UlaG (beta-lactamase superfamily)